MTVELLITVLGTAVAVAVAMGAAGFWIVRAIIAQDIKPLSDTMIALQGSIKGLTVAMDQGRADGIAHREELHEAINGIREMLTAHQRDLAGHETRITVLEAPSKTRPKGTAR